MFINYNRAYFLFLFILSVIEAGFVKINWNISTDRGHSYSEREYNYLTHQEAAPVPCYLTDSCDTLCRQGSNCDNSQGLTFQTSKQVNNCEEPLSPFDCRCDIFDKPEWHSIFCYIFKNPIYLGKFFQTPKKIEKYGSLKSLLDKKRFSFYKYRQTGETKPKSFYQYGSPIMTFVPASDSFPSVNPLLIKIPFKDSTFACRSNPVSFKSNNLFFCLTKVSYELCQKGFPLSALPYLVQGGNLFTYSSLPMVLKDLNFLKGIETEVTIKCVTLKPTTIKYKKQLMNYFQKIDTKPCEDSFRTYHTVLINKTCQNILVYVQYEFVLNGSDIIKLKAEYGLGNMPLVSGEFGDNVSHKYIYLQQIFSVNFFDVMINFNKENIFKNDELLNRGYFVGEELNFGFKHTNNSSVTWEKGFLGVFKNGDSCDDSSPVTFGFDYFSVCQIRMKFSNCSHLRIVIEQKFEALIKGVSLAVYGNLRAPYNVTVPLLRNFRNFTEKNPENSTDCYVPTAQDIFIQYTSINTPSERIIHRILGVRVDRPFLNISLDKDVALTSRVLFFYVSSSKDKPMSRFWNLMLSPERSENSWLQMLNAFDDVTSNEREEITFWSILLFLLFSAAFACTKLDVDFFEVVLSY